MTGGRAGEGAPYTGLRPAGRDLGPAIPAADKALETGSVDAVLKLLTDATGHGVRERFAELMARKSFETDDVAAGREYVHAYVIFAHYVEGLYRAACASPHSHTTDVDEHVDHDSEHTQGHENHHTAAADLDAVTECKLHPKSDLDELHAELGNAATPSGKGHDVGATE